MATYFRPAFFEFLAELKANNNRAWFDANRERFVEQVETPMLDFIAAVGERLPRISRNFVASPRRVGGSLFRIHRDVRFSKDKTPFKPAMGAHFSHAARAAGKSVPGFYLHLEPGLCVGGGGIYQPDPGALERIRGRIVAKPAEWERVRKEITIEGTALKRPPAGYEPEHRFIDDIKRKDLYSLTAFGVRAVCSSRFLDTYMDACERAAPLVRFIATAAGLRW